MSAHITPDGCFCGASSDQVQVHLTDERMEAQISESLERHTGRVWVPRPGCPMLFYYCTVCFSCTFTVLKDETVPR